MGQMGISSFPEAAQALSARAARWAKEGRHADAVQLLVEAERLAPESPLPHTSRAAVALEQGVRGAGEAFSSLVAAARQAPGAPVESAGWAFNTLAALALALFGTLVTVVAAFCFRYVGPLGRDLIPRGPMWRAQLAGGALLIMCWCCPLGFGLGIQPSALIPLVAVSPYLRRAERWGTAVLVAAVTALPGSFRALPSLPSPADQLARMCLSETCPPSARAELTQSVGTDAGEAALLLGAVELRASSATGKVSERARELLHQAVVARPQDLRALIASGNARVAAALEKCNADRALALRELEIASELYRQALALEPHCVPALVNLAWLRERDGKAQEATALLEQARRQDPSEFERWLTRRADAWRADACPTSINAVAMFLPPDWLAGARGAAGTPARQAAGTYWAAFGLGPGAPVAAAALGWIALLALALAPLAARAVHAHWRCGRCGFTSGGVERAGSRKLLLCDLCLVDLARSDVHITSARLENGGRHRLRKAVWVGLGVLGPPGFGYGLRGWAVGAMGAAFLFWFLLAVVWLSPGWLRPPHSLPALHGAAIWIATILAAAVWSVSLIHQALLARLERRAQVGP
jgi:tetratricopeptide (TPR) repeat protein